METSADLSDDDQVGVVLAALGGPGDGDVVAVKASPDEDGVGGVDRVGGAILGLGVELGRGSRGPTPSRRRDIAVEPSVGVVAVELALPSDPRAKSRPRPRRRRPCTDPRKVPN